MERNVERSVVWMCSILFSHSSLPASSLLFPLFFPSFKSLLCSDCRSLSLPLLPSPSLHLLWERRVPSFSRLVSPRLAFSLRPDAVGIASHPYSCHFFPLYFYLVCCYRIFFRRYFQLLTQVLDQVNENPEVIPCVFISLFFLWLTIFYCESSCEKSTEKMMETELDFCWRSEDSGDDSTEDDVQDVLVSVFPIYLLYLLSLLRNKMPSNVISDLDPLSICLFRRLFFLTSCQTLSCLSSETIWHLSQMSLSSDIATDSLDSVTLCNWNNRSGQRVEETYQDQEEDITWSSSTTDWCQKLCKPNILTSIMTWMTMILPMMQKWLSLVPPVSRVCLFQK